MSKVRHTTFFSTVREKQFITYLGTFIILSEDFIVETLQVRGELDDIFSYEEKKPANQEYYMAKLSIRNGDIRTHLDK